MRVKKGKAKVSYKLRLLHILPLSIAFIAYIAYLFQNQCFRGQFVQDSLRGCVVTQCKGRS